MNKDRRPFTIRNKTSIITWVNLDKKYGFNASKLFRMRMQCDANFYITRINPEANYPD